MRQCVFEREKQTSVSIGFIMRFKKTLKRLFGFSKIQFWSELLLSYRVVFAEKKDIKRYLSLSLVVVVRIGFAPPARHHCCVRAMMMMMKSFLREKKRKRDQRRHVRDLDIKKEREIYLDRRRRVLHVQSAVQIRTLVLFLRCSSVLLHHNVLKTVVVVVLLFLIGGCKMQIDCDVFFFV